MNDELSDDIDAMLEDAPNSVEVLLGTQCVHGLLVMTDGERIKGRGAHSVGKTIAVEVAAGALAGLAVGAAIQVDGVDYIVRERLQADSGLTTRVLCHR